MNQQNTTNYTGAINGLDNQILILQAKRREMIAERAKTVPNHLDKMMSQSKKRKRDELEKTEEFVALSKLLSENKKPNAVTAEDLNDVVSSNQEGNAELKKIKVRREVYDEEVKKMVVKLAKTFTKNDISDKTKISVNNIKRWKSQEKKDIVADKRGRRVLYPELEEELKNCIRLQRTQNNHLSVRRLLREARMRAAKQNKTALKFTWGWVTRFMKRNKFKLRKPTTKVSNVKDKEEALNKLDLS